MTNVLGSIAEVIRGLGILVPIMGSVTGFIEIADGET